ncbi:MAG: DNA polymerase III subunit gamma/tau [Verrucomicrobiota bacterium]|nr:DNA polymerase III subunit gamma/tau [Verrucomicrobiota bacterium]
MAYEVLARKWRPQQFDDVIGQEHVTTTLRNAVRSKRLANAYLFVGPRGTGKTSVARILAKALNCHKGPTVTPCDACDACREIAAGTSLDVMEIDGASNNSVDQVRALRDTVQYAPARGPYKIYIIDEVHMLSPAAFNALLKTIEEPPSYVRFIFATTEPHKVLATIVSRCQRFDLRRIPVNLIIERLKLIAKAEAVTISEDALLAIARSAEGGLRDAESALDQLIAFKGKTIEEEDALSVFGLVSRSLLEELAGRILRGDIPELIRRVAEIDQSGKDLQRLVFELIEHFRNLLVFLSVENGAAIEDLAETQAVVLEKQAALTTMERALRIVGILTDVEERMRYALSRRTLLETALIRCARAVSVATLEEILARINELRQESNGGPAPAEELNLGLRSSGADQKPMTEPPVSPAPGGAARAEPESGNADELAKLREHWDDVLAAAGRIAVGGGIQHLLKDALPLRVAAEKVVIAFEPEFAGELDSFKAQRNRVAVEHGLQEVLRRAVTAEFVVRSPDGESPATVPTNPSKGQSAKQLLDDPAVRKTLETFKGKILDVRA